VALAAACPACASPALPRTAGAPGDRAADGIREKIVKLMESQGLPSVCAVAVKDGVTRFEECFGYANVDRKIAATPDTMYALASITKPVTAMGLMTLVESRKVNLDRPANDYLGEAKLVARVGEASGATVRRILRCTAGLPEHLNMFYANEEAKRPAAEESIRRYGFLATAPGETFTYTNFGYGILEHIIERVSGQEYAPFVKARVFGPLGMTRTAILTEAPNDDNVAVKYDPKAKALAFTDYDHRGASAAYGSVRDLVRLARFISKTPLRDQKAILRGKTIDLMLNDKDPDAGEGLLRLGWTVFEHEGYSLIHASGGMRGAAARIGIVQKEGLISVVATNTYTGSLWDIERAVYEAYLPGYAEKAKAAKPEEAAPQRAFAPAAAVQGAWSGTISTFDGPVPVRLVVEADGVRFELAGRALPVIKIPPGLVDWRLTYENGVLTIPLGGNFLPYWIELRKEGNP
jgi:CubicO group peptidase (beta-lactamase class C family)